ncbi:DUF1772 domain-containing protein [Flagellimonas lutimaris]|jgi:uncharacterized membrane protein|uniref:DUF1772 domain-containing protein n=1 Tax=Flagellimonas lutimaris TaxID=475082 RepID=A0A3A1N9U4_9FLAO|nr:DUF1772 domain-containing protein [Allomuricauda lutimaris]RIV35417.1 DUF1772 domain-containing protein [Allomuricauda lutimaris]|tara:strand:+ start:2424 stop:2933 length:510 start_codon:yes stop_codon:yes gene_type:complete
MTYSINTLTLISTILLTGLTAGLCFTWTNAVTPGIGRLDNLGYLQAFQEMNRAIINPLFLLVFFGPFLTHIANVYLHRNQSNMIFWMLFAAGMLYVAGVVVITILGNVPLNEILDKTDLQVATPKQLKELRNLFEVKWSRLHLIRTVTSALSFLLLILSLLQNQINTNT